MSVRFYALGCRLNQAENDHLARELGEYPDEVLIVNTCAVTAKAERKSRQYIQQQKAKNNQLKIIAMGCAVKFLRGHSAIDLYIENMNKRRAVKTIREFINRFARDEALPRQYKQDVLRTHSRQLIKIQDGCAEKCAYCIVPQLRGMPTSVPPKIILAEIAAVQPVAEIVLTGVHIARYRPTLAGLVKQIIKKFPQTRVRLSSIEPQYLSTDIIKLYENPRVCRYLHLAVQSGSDSVLKRMNRRYTATRLWQIIALVRKICPQIFISADIIVGFPGETAAEFAKTETLIRDLKLAKLHVFPFSPRPGTSAAEMLGQIPDKIRNARAARLRQLSDQLYQRYSRQFIGKTLEMVVEKSAGGVVEGVTDNYLKVLAESGPEKARIGSLRLVTYEGYSARLSPKSFSI